MAKGFMVFVDGGDIPRVLHESYESAWKTAKTIAAKYPEREVLLLEFHKRFKGSLSRPKSEADFRGLPSPYSVRKPSHVPENPRATRNDP